MRHYSLIPVRYNEQQILVRCEPVDAELWSIQWIGIGQQCEARMYWFADLAPTEYAQGQAIVQWLNNREIVQSAMVEPANFTITQGE